MATPVTRRREGEVRTSWKPGAQPLRLQLFHQPEIRRPLVRRLQVEGYSQAAIARALGVGNNTIAFDLKRGRRSYDPCEDLEDALWAAPINWDSISTYLEAAYPAVEDWFDASRPERLGL